jgi:hypothetical protein
MIEHVDALLREFEREALLCHDPSSDTTPELLSQDLR